ncbi:cxorf58 protein [Plakobranchus ocellatus]|uniref:Cxorf58 protein n=1 Tax=Plakobranchus ocellatus TaxID=259542 RepID=A0AAV4E0Q1_9GAST|nr:cxorf58 protein [Plakobranchus ocellatus]
MSVGGASRSQLSSRRSKQARLRAFKMRRLYSKDMGEGDVAERDNAADDEEEDDYFNKYGADGDEGGPFDRDGDDIDEEEEWDKEGSRLYEWTQELSFNDDIMQTPMMTV